MPPLNTAEPATSALAPVASTNSFDAHGTLEVGEQSYEIYRLAAVEGSQTLPYSLKVLLENLLRTEDGANITADHIRAVGSWDPKAEPDVGGLYIGSRNTGAGCPVSASSSPAYAAAVANSTSPTSHLRVFIDPLGWKMPRAS